MEKMKSILREYKNGNKWVRIGAWILAVGLSLFIASAIGLLYLWLTDFPLVGVPCPSWIVTCLLEGFLYMVIGMCCVAFGMEPPGGGKRKKKQSRSVAPVGALKA